MSALDDAISGLAAEVDKNHRLSSELLERQKISLARLEDGLREADRRAHAGMAIAAYLGSCVGIVAVAGAGIDPVVTVIALGLGYGVNVWAALRR